MDFRLYRHTSSLTSAFDCNHSPALHRNLRKITQDIIDMVLKGTACKWIKRGEKQPFNLEDMGYNHYIIHLFTLYYIILYIRALFCFTKVKRKCWLHKLQYQTEALVAWLRKMHNFMQIRSLCKKRLS